MNALKSISLFAALALAAGAFALDNDGLIKLKNAGFDEATILLKMDTEPADYDLSTDGLISLKGAGISEEVIQKALRLNAGESNSDDTKTSSSGSSSSSGSTTYTPPTPNGGGARSVFQQDLPSIAPPEIQPVLGGRYFTRISFWHEKREHIATNYTRGTLVPINTEVELVQYKSKLFEIRRLDTGEVIKMVNVPKYTGESVESLPSRYLSEQPTPLERLPDEVAKSIVSGQMRLGMSKEITLMARGYPPEHETPSIQSDRWVYWSSRFVKLTVVFRNDHIIEGRGLY